jgi:hypothetical protein
MGHHRIHLYASGSTWLAAGRSALAPVNGTHRDAAEQSWETVAQEMRKQLGKGHAVSLVLSARLCHFIVLPWVSTCYTGGAIRRYVVDAFATARGVTEARHRIEIHWPDYGAPILAVAYPRALVEVLRSALASAGFQLGSVVPSVMPVLTKYGRGLGQGSLLLAYGEDDGVTAITLEDGRVAQVEALARDGHGLEDMAVWSSRKRMAFASDDALRWLTTCAAPETFAGKHLALQGIDKPRSAGHAVVAACR